MIHQVESTAPKLLIFTHITPEWYEKSKSWKELDKWFFSFAKLHYLPFARFEYNNIKDTLLITDTNSLLKKPTHIFWITIYEKRDI
jgi:hypothetical protein